MLPYLDLLVPAAGNNDGVGGVGGEPHTRHPVSVALLLQTWGHKHGRNTVYIPC